MEIFDRNRRLSRKRYKQAHGQLRWIIDRKSQVRDRPVSIGSDGLRDYRLSWAHICMLVPFVLERPNLAQ